MASCLKLTFFFFVVPLLLLVFSPGIPPEDIQFEAEEVTKVPFKGRLAANNKLDLAEDFPSEVEEGVGFGKLGVRLEKLICLCRFLTFYYTNRVLRRLPPRMTTCTPD